MKLSKHSLKLGVTLSLALASLNSHATLDRNVRPYQMHPVEKTGAIYTLKNGETSSQAIKSTTVENHYIIEFTEAPVSQIKTNLYKQYTQQIQAYQHRLNHSVNSKTINELKVKKKQIKQNYTSKVHQYKTKLVAHQNMMIDQWRKNDVIEAVSQQFTLAINAIAVHATPAQIRELKKDKRIKHISRSETFTTQLEQSVNLVNAPLVWAQHQNSENTIEGQNITVAVIDTGIDYNHPDLGGCLGEGCKVINGYDFVNNDADPFDDHAHGTHVAGIIAADGQLKGVAPKANLVAIKVLDQYGSGLTSDIIAGIEYAMDPDGNPATEDAVDVMNLSLGGIGDKNSPISQAVNNAVNAGITAVVAAGNNGNYEDIPNLSPSSAELAITVASSTKEDQLADYSSKGGLKSPGIFKPEIIAPGSFINSTMPANSYMALSGTSMAAPHVAGGAALLKQQYPHYTPKQIKARLMAGAVDIDQDPLAQGIGRMNIKNSMSSELLIVDAGLNFGSMNDENFNPNAQRSFKLFNASSEDKVVTIKPPQGLPEGIVLSTKYEKYRVPANGYKTIHVSLNVEDPQSIPYPTHKAGIFFDYFSIESEDAELKLPVVFGKRSSLVFNVEDTIQAIVSVSISDIESKSVETSVKYYPSEPLKIDLVPGVYDILVEYNDIHPSSLPHLDFADFGPKISDPSGTYTFEQLYLIGVETFRVVLGEDTSTVNLALENLVNSHVPQSVLDLNGVERIQDIDTESMSMQVEFADRLAVARLGFIPGRDLSFYVGWLSGHIDSDSRVNFSRLERINNPKENKPTLLHSEFHLPSDKQLSTDVDLAKYAITEIGHSMNQENSTIGYAINTIPKYINFEVENELPILKAFESNIDLVSIMLEGEQNRSSIKLLTGAGTFFPTLLAQSAKIEEQESIDLSGKSTFFSGALEHYPGGIYDIFERAVSDTQNNSYFGLEGMDYSIKCDDQIVIDQENYTPSFSHYLSLNNCLTLELNFNFPSTLENTANKSSVKHLINKGFSWENASITGLKDIALHDGQQLLSGQYVDSNNASIVITTYSDTLKNWYNQEFSGFGIQNLSVEVQVADEEWVQLDLAPYEEMNNSFIGKLPNVEGTEFKPVSLRVKYDTYNVESEQYLEHFFLYRNSHLLESNNLTSTH